MCLLRPGYSEVWYRARFGIWRPWVRVPLLRPPATQDHLVISLLERITARNVKAEMLHGSMVGQIRGISSVGRVPAFQAEGRGFESRIPLQASNKIVWRSVETNSWIDISYLWSLI